MKKIILLLTLALLTINFGNSNAHAALISTGKYRHEQNKINKAEAKQIKELFKVHETFANKHDITGLKSLYSDNYINSDGMNKDVYFKTVEGCEVKVPGLTLTSTKTHHLFESELILSAYTGLAA